MPPLRAGEIRENGLSYRDHLRLEVAVDKDVPANLKIEQAKQKISILGFVLESL